MRRLIKFLFRTFSGWVIVLFLLFTAIMIIMYIFIGQSDDCLPNKEKWYKFLALLKSFIFSVSDNDKERAQDLLVKLETLAIAISGLVYSAIRIHRTEEHRREDNEKHREDNERQEKLRREDEQKRIYGEALEKLYSIDKFRLQLLGISELYDLYPDKSKDESILIAKSNKSLKIKILDCISLYLRDVDKNDKDDIKINPSVRNRVLKLFFSDFSKESGNKEYPENYKFDLKWTHLNDACLSGANLKDANLRGAELQGAELQGAKLQGADLQGADLQEAHLKDSDLQEADLRKAKLLVADLREADLREADLREADLMRAKLLGADLEGANLEIANLQGAHLEMAHLKWAHLRMAHLRMAHLQEADLEMAYLQGADLTGAKLQGAYLTGANLRGAIVGLVANTDIKEDKDYDSPWSDWERKMAHCWEDYGYMAKIIDKDTAYKSGLYTGFFNAMGLDNAENFYFRVLVKKEESGVAKLGKVEIPLTDCPPE